MSEKCEEMEKLERIHHSFDLYKNIREFTQTQKKRKTGKRFNCRHEIVIEEKDQQDLWNIYIRKTFDDIRI